MERVEWRIHTKSVKQVCKWVGNEVGEIGTIFQSNRGWGGCSVESAEGGGAPTFGTAWGEEERRRFGGAPVVLGCSGDVRKEERRWRRFSVEGLGERESGCVL